MTVVWVNLHGGFVAGMGALGIFLFFHLVVPVIRKVPVRRQAGFLWLSGILCLFALFVNPYGWGLLRFLWGDLRIDRPITEWDAVPLWDLSFLEFKLAILVVLFSMRKSSWLKWDFVLTLVTAALALRHQRHTPLFALAAAPFLAQGMERIMGLVGGMITKGKQAGLSGPAQRTLIAGILVIAIVQLVWLGRTHWNNRFRIIVSPSEYPLQAADFLLRNRIGGNMAVPFDWGEYFIWKLYPRGRVSIDGRYTTAYPMEVIDASWEWMRGGKQWRRLLDHYPTEIVITNRHHPVTGLMQKDNRWVYIYSDPVSFIFVRDAPSQAGLLERFRSGGLINPQITSTHFPG